MTHPAPATPEFIHDDLRPLWPDLLAGHPKAVHEARKLSRKVSAELALTSGTRRERRAWRDLRRALAPLRDHDITGDHLLTALSRAGTPQPELDTFRQDWARRRAALHALLTLPDPPGPAPKAGGTRKAARKTLARHATHLIRESRTVLNSRDAEAWHDWRKELKTYRYTLDTLIPTPKVLKATLDALGRMQDAEVVLDLLGRPEWTHPGTASLQRRERRARTRAQTRVRELWPDLRVLLEAHAEGQGLKAKKP